MGSERLLCHFVAFVVVVIWGSTFVFTKLLLQVGLSPAEIFTLRFLIAYVLLLGYDLFSTRGGSKFLTLHCSLLRGATSWAWCC